MFAHSSKKNPVQAAFALGEIIYHSTVRKIRSTHRNAFIALLISFSQVVTMLVIFYAMFSLLGLRTSAVRGDFLLYLLSGIFLYITHIQTVVKIFGAEGPTSVMMKHAPMNTFIGIASAALSVLYLKTVIVILILFIYHTGFNRITIHDPIGAYGMLLLSWFFGIAVGLIFMSMKIWAPSLSNTIRTFYTRANMITSGKMFLANTLPPFMLAIFDWNPLFHIIDQARGYIFINYVPQNSSWQYAFWVSVALLMFGFLLEFYTRKHASISWGAAQ
ncbi:MAG: ABC transporter permease [Pseudoruegeria sp.]